MEPITFITESSSILENYYYEPLQIKGTIRNNTPKNISFCLSCDNGNLVENITLKPDAIQGRNIFPVVNIPATIVEGENTISGGKNDEFTIYVRDYNLKANMTLSLKNLNGDIIASSVIEFPNLQNR